MTITQITITFLTLWWLTLFAVLPFGVRRPDALEEGHCIGAPEKAGLKKKLIANTLLAAFFTAIIYAVIDSGHITIHTIAEFFGT